MKPLLARIERFHGQLHTSTKSIQKNKRLITPRFDDEIHKRKEERLAWMESIAAALANRTNRSLTDGNATIGTTQE